MHGRKLRVLFGSAWLPLYVLVGMSWLLAPAVAHEHYGILQAISTEEAHHRIADEWFRVNDILAALLLLIAIGVFGVRRRSRKLGGALLTIAALMAIDGLFPDKCGIGRLDCGVSASAITIVHVAESVILGLLVFALSTNDAWRSRRAASVAFVGLQLAGAGAFLSGLAPKQFIFLLLYLYESAMIIWLAWFVDRYNFSLRLNRYDHTIRQVLGWSVAFGGIFALIAAAPHAHFVRHWAQTPATPLGLLLAQHGIIVGVLLLYLARHLLRGERPALWLAGILFYSQIIKYSVITPQPFGLIIYALLLALLLYARGSFTRNTQPPSWLSRWNDVAVVVIGSLLAAILLLGIVTASGQRLRFWHDVTPVYNQPFQAIDQRQDNLSPRRQADLRVLAETLGVSLAAVIIWSLFRPKSFGLAAGRTRIPEDCRQLLERHSISSEDFFKLWPRDKEYFSAPGVIGLIAYRIEMGVAFMLADPIAPTEIDRQHLLKRFTGFCRERGLIACALLIGGKSPKMYQTLGWRSIQIGSSAVIDIDRFNGQTVSQKWWRWQRNRAERQDWQYARLVPPHFPELLDELRQVSDSWLGMGRKSELTFALGYFAEDYLQQCVVHVLRGPDGRIIAFANELPVFGKVRQASVDLIRYLPDADGAMPALLLRIINGLAGSKFATFDLGFVPLAQQGGDLAKILRRVGRSRFSAAGLEQFKNKFDPEWQPDFLAYDGDLLDLAKIAPALDRVLRPAKIYIKDVQ